MTTLARSGRACVAAIGRAVLRPIVRPLLRRDLGRALTSRSGPFVILQQRDLRVPQAAAAERVLGALALVQSYDPGAFRRMQTNMTTIYLAKVSKAHYLIDLRVCVLPVHQVLDEGLSALAFTLVHEATHARIARAGIGWWPRVEARIERICLKKEEGFAARLELAGFDVGGMRAWLDRAISSLEPGT